ncbi:MAG: adenosylcobinamide-GDP ribazoletransferase [Chloroflexi bacterium]|nr:adenosylcobinamide-GDP ribazoletransferase [Chloroflexota bacterium]
MSSFIAAVRFLTVVPIGGSRADNPRAVATSPAFFPIVGLAIGLALGVLDLGLAQVLPGNVGAAIVVAAMIAVTGALHLDGLADAADGLFGGKTAERRRAIMKDPAVGVFGASAVGAVLLIKWTAISELDSWERFAALAVAPMLGRTAALLLVRAFPYTNATGLGSLYERPGIALMWLPFVFTIAVSSLVFGAWAAVILIPVAIVAFAFGKFAASRLGGRLSGDIYGASSELGEVVSLIIVVALVEGGAGVSALWS